MKALDYFLLICVIAFLVISYFVENAELKALVTFGATACGAVLGGRWGGRQYKKNQENK